MLGAVAALLLLSNHLFFTLSTLAMTDGLLLSFTAGAMYCLYSDPWLESRPAFWGFAACSASLVRWAITLRSFCAMAA